MLTEKLIDEGGKRWWTIYLCLGFVLNVGRYLFLAYSDGYFDNLSALTLCMGIGGAVVLSIPAFMFIQPLYDVVFFVLFCFNQGLINICFEMFYESKLLVVLFVASCLLPVLDMLWCLAGSLLEER